MACHEFTIVSSVRVDACSQGCFGSVGDSHYVECTTIGSPTSGIETKGLRSEGDAFLWDNREAECIVVVHRCIVVGRLIEGLMRFCHAALCADGECSVIEFCYAEQTWLAHFGSCGVVGAFA